MKTILLIEDDYLDVESIRRTFTKMKLEHYLYVAHNGVDALEMLTSEDKKINPDLILLDINMPKMNGLEFLRIIKNYSRLKNIEIFILTTSEEEYDKSTTEHLGISGYILKPLKFSENTVGDAGKLLAFLLAKNG
jgi:CheY-like chemotaxis protein